MARLRSAKRQAALVIALADIADVWPLPRVTRALSRSPTRRSGGAAPSAAAAAASGRLSLAHPDDPERDSGLIVLGMGKLGGARAELFLAISI